MPIVDSFAQRLAVPAEVARRAGVVAATFGLRRDEVVELALRSRLDPDGPAAKLWESFHTGNVRTTTSIALALAAEGVTGGVRGLRLGSPAPDRTPVPWDRDGIGVSLTASPFEAWPIVRGIWKMRTVGIEIIAALRLGHVLGVYRVDEWAHHTETGRKYAVGGAVITTDGRLLDAADGTDRGPATVIDRRVWNILTGHPIVVPPNQQPVIRLTER